MDLGLHDERGAQTPVKALKLFEAVIAKDGEAPLSQIAQELGLPTSTAYRLCKAYLECGWLQRRKRGVLGPGPKFVSAALSMNRHSALAEAARPALEQLAEALGQTTHLGIFEHGMVTYLVKADPKHGPLIATQEGMQLEAYCSGIGKALLAYLPQEDVEAYLSDGPFIALTEKTKTSADAIERELRKIKDQGFALDDGEFSADLFCVAVPLFNLKGQAFAAISTSTIGAPPFKIRRDFISAMSMRLNETAARLHLSTRPNAD